MEYETPLQRPSDSRDGGGATVPSPAKGTFASPMIRSRNLLGDRKHTFLEYWQAKKFKVLPQIVSHIQGKSEVLRGEAFDPAFASFMVPRQRQYAAVLGILLRAAVRKHAGSLRTSTLKTSLVECAVSNILTFLPLGSVVPEGQAVTPPRTFVSQEERGTTIGGVALPPAVLPAVGMESPLGLASPSPHKKAAVEQTAPDLSPGSARKRDRDDSTVAVGFGEDLLPTFFLWPPVQTPRLFVRLLTSSRHTTTFGGEDLNRYFARYGFVREESVTHITKPSLSSSGALACQDFLVELDSVHNVLSAYDELDHPDVLFLAFAGAAVDPNELAAPAAGKNNFTPGGCPLYSILELPTIDELLAASFTGFSEKLLGATQQQQQEEEEQEQQEANEGEQSKGQQPPTVSEAIMSRRNSSLFATVLSVGDTGKTITGTGSTVVRSPPEQLPHILSALIEYQQLVRHKTVGELGVEEDTMGAADAFVPDIVVDNIPWWTTVDQLMEYCSRFGRVRDIRLATSDRCGVSLGCIAVNMFTVQEALRLEDGMNGLEIDGYTLMAGVVGEEGSLVSLRDPSVVLLAEESGGAGAKRPPTACMEEKNREPTVGSFGQTRLWL